MSDEKDGSEVDEYAVAFVKRYNDAYTNLEKQVRNSSKHKTTQDPRLKTALQQIQQNDPQDSILLEEVDVGDAGAEQMAAVLLTNTKLQALSVKNVGIGDRGVCELMKAVSKHGTLKTLELNGNNIGLKGARAIAEMLEHNTPLETLGLSSCHLNTSGFQLIAKGLRKNSQLKQLSLCHNQPGFEGFNSLVSALTGGRAMPGNMSVQTLHMNDCGIHDAEAKLLGQLLSSKHCRCTNLSFAGNRITSNAVLDQLEQSARDGAWYQYAPLEFMRDARELDDSASRPAATANHTTQTSPSPPQSAPQASQPSARSPLVLAVGVLVLVGVVLLMRSRDKSI